MKTHLFLLVTLFPLAAFSAQPEEGSVCVDTNPGKLCGTAKTVLGKELLEFYGIPYALPPVGEFRFRTPKLMKKWEGVLDAAKPGKSCLQDYSMKGMSESFDAFQPDQTDTSEDCLFLNIVAPKNAENLPVMLWIHGGGYIIGSGSLPMFNGDAMVAEADVVYVSVNYRLGMLGFGYLGSKTMPGNMGLFDQRMAMKWVHENIVHFGGNPDKVTIYGESAGGASIAAHLAAPKSHKYFSSAIVQSGTLFSNWAMKRPEDAKAMVHQLAAHLGCDTTSDNDSITKCLKEKPGQDLTISLRTAFFDFMGTPTNPDPSFFSGDAFSQLSNPSIDDKKIMIGFTAEEAGMMVPFATNLTLAEGQEDSWALDSAQLAQLVDATLVGYDSKIVGQLLSEYRSLDKSNVFRFIRLMSEIQFDCPTLEFTRALAKVNLDNVYLYKFDHTPSKNLFSAILGSYHSTEVAFHMGTPLIEDGWSEGDKQFSKQMIRMWTSLEKSGTPSVNNDWPPIGSAASPSMRLIHAEHPKLITEHPDVRCQLLIDGRPKEKRFWKEEL